MTKERMEEEKRYLATMSIAKNLLKQGIISEEEYCQIDTKFKEQYAVSFSTLFTDINLINYGKCGNMWHWQGGIIWRKYEELSQIYQG